jgi:heavy metal translocating P-type ATPase
MGPVVSDDANSPLDVKIDFPERAVIRIESTTWFTDADGPSCRRFVERAFLARQISSAVISPASSAGAAPAIDLHFDAERYDQGQVLEQLAAHLEARSEFRRISEAPSALIARDRHGIVRYHRYGQRITGWKVVRERVGEIRLENPVLYRKAALCQAIERELMSVLGVERYETNAQKCRAKIEYDPRRISPAQIIEILDGALANAEHPDALDRQNWDLALCTVSVPLAVIAQFAAPSLLPLSGALLLYTTIPTFRGAYDVIVRRRRLGIDFLDAVVVLRCLATLQLLPGAMLAWCLAAARSLVRHTEDNSKKLLLGAFGKQPRYVWLIKDNIEIEIPLGGLEKGDIVAVHTGEVVPVDGVIVDGMAMIDQQALTGESMPAEKGVGDRVYASTVMVAGKIHVAVEKSGGETATARIAQILNDSIGHKLALQHKGEQLADKVVLPTLGLGGLAYTTLGPAGSVAVINSDLGTGIRMAAPLAMLSTLAVCAQKGILVKDGRALDLLCEIDTVLFDKTGTLTRERPEVGRVIAANGFATVQILGLAAAAEQRFHHPIALAIRQKAGEEGLDLPPTDATQYQVGYGITVGIGGRRVRVGSRRFMQAEGVALNPEVEAALDECHREGNTMVMCAVDDELGGAIELRASVRPEVRDIVRGLRQRGIKHIAIISGDHEAPTRKLAEELGIDRYFAQVLPADKAYYVEQLQLEGHKVCFVGDGINDAVALKKANVSISLRGATSIATDTAHVVFMEQSLGKLCELHDIARGLSRNVHNSWLIILSLNLSCIAGVFTLGFGIGASVLTNNIAGLSALANGLLPMRKVLQIEAERRHIREMELRENGYIDVESALARDPWEHSGITGGGASSC